MSSFLKDMRLSGGVLVGNGWVGLYHSPGTSPLGTGRSSTGKAGLPVTRSNAYHRPLLFTEVTILRFWPPMVTSSRGPSLGWSVSHRSWCTVWKYQRSLPVLTSTATIELPYRFAPGRSPPQ